MPFVTTNGITLAYEAEGDPQGEAILLIAGLGLQLISWPQAFCKGLTDHGFRVIRFDNRDSGLSTKMRHLGKPNLQMAFFRSLFHMPLHTGYTLYDMANDTVGLLDALDIEHAHVVGASMGGMIAQILAAREARRVLSLTSVMSTSGRPGLPGPTFAANNAMFSRPSNPRHFDSIVEHYVRLFRVIGSPGYPTPDDELRRQVIAAARRNVSASGTARQIVAVAATGDRSAQLRRIDVPTLVIHGTDDPLVPVAAGRDTARLIPGAIMHEIKGMGHDFPPGLNGVLSDLIAEHCNAASETREA